MTKKPKSEESLVVTLNKMGWMLEKPELYNDAFIDYAANVPGPCLEIGAAYGVSTLAALKKGARMIANDLSPDHLKILWAETPDDLKNNLTLMPGAFPEAITLEKNTLDAVLSSRMLNFLPPEALQSGLKTIFDWLKPGGKFFVVLSSPFMGNFESFLPQYWQNIQNAEPHPGYIHTLSDIAPNRADNLPASINLINLGELATLLTSVGFHIEKISYSGARDDHPKDMRSDGREHVGAIAIKP